MKNFKKGFTLIELLVVVAIIGVLTTIVLVLLGNAKSKSIDSAIKSEMSSLINQAELYANGGSYSDLFIGNNSWDSNNLSVKKILTAVDKKTTVHTAGSSTSAWAAQAQLKEDTTKYFCVDNSGKKTISTTAMASGSTVCP